MEFLGFFRSLALSCLEGELPLRHIHRLRTVACNENHWLSLPGGTWLPVLGTLGFSLLCNPVASRGLSAQDSVCSKLFTWTR